VSHEILGERFISRERPAWHGLGTLFDADERISAEEAVKRVAGDISVQTFPVKFTMPMTGADGKVQEMECTVDDQVVVVRMPTHDDPNPEPFGIVGKNWKADPYPVLARSLNKLSETYRVETAGLLKDGALCFLALRGEPWDVKGDPMESYFTANLSLRPGEGHKVFHSPVRVVCWNTNTMALSQSTITLRIKHGMDAKQQIGLAGDLIVRFKEAQDKTKELCEAFANREVDVEEAKQVIDAAYPDPQVPHKIQQFRNACGSPEAYEMFMRTSDPKIVQTIQIAEERFEQLLKKQANLRETAFARYSGFNPKDMQGTLWAAYNSVTEVSDWREGRNADESCLFGARAAEKSRAFAASVAILDN